MSPMARQSLQPPPVRTSSKERNHTFGFTRRIVSAADFSRISSISTAPMHALHHLPHVGNEQ